MKEFVVPSLGLNIRDLGLSNPSYVMDQTELNLSGKSLEEQKRILSEFSKMVIQQGDFPNLAQENTFSTLYSFARSFSSLHVKELFVDLLCTLMSSLVNGLKAFDVASTNNPPNAAADLRNSYKICVYLLCYIANISEKGEVFKSSSATATKTSKKTSGGAKATAKKSKKAASVKDEDSEPEYSTSADDGEDVDDNDEEEDDDDGGGQSDAGDDDKKKKKKKSTATKKKAVSKRTTAPTTAPPACT